MNILKIKRALAELVWTGALLFAAASVFLRPGAAAGGVLRGLSVCYETVIPALFPFLVLSRLLLESRAASALGLLLRPYTRLLGLHSTKAPAAMLCGVLGGFAGGAKAVDVLYRTGELTAAEAALLLVCTIGSGPGFVVSSGIRGASSARTCRKTEAPITLSAAQHSCVRQADAVSQAARHALVTSRGSVAQKRTDASAPVGTAMAAKKENSVT